MAKARKKVESKRIGRTRATEDTATEPYPLPEPDAHWWTLISSGGNLLRDRKPIEETNRVALRQKARHLARFNPHVRAIVRNTVKYVLGRGVMPRWPDKVDDDVRKLWNAFSDASNWRKRAREILIRRKRDGEVFIRKFTDDVVVDGQKRRVVVPRFIDPELVKKPGVGGTEEDGIVTDPDDVETVLSYWKLEVGDPTGQKGVSIPAKSVIHDKCECDMNEKRGVTPLAPIMPFAELYHSWLQDRMVLSKVRSSVALVRTFDASAGQIQSFLSDEQSRESDERSRRGERKPTANSEVKQKRFRPGTIINARKGVDYKFISPNLQASDVHHDGRALLLAITAGTGFAEFIITGDASNNAYASSLVAEGPAVKEFQEEQEELGQIFTQIWVWAVEDAKKAGWKIDASYDPKTVTWAWPDMVSRNRLNDVQGNKIMVEAGAMSRRTMMERDGVDFVVEKERLESDQLLPPPPSIVAKQQKAMLATGLKGAPGTPRPFAGKQGGSQAAGGNSSINDPDVPEPTSPMAGAASRNEEIERAKADARIEDKLDEVTSALADISRTKEPSQAPVHVDVAPRLIVPEVALEQIQTALERNAQVSEEALKFMSGVDERRKLDVAEAAQKGVEAAERIRPPERTDGVTVDDVSVIANLAARSAALEQAMVSSPPPPAAPQVTVNPQISINMPKPRKTRITVQRDPATGDAIGYDIEYLD